MSSGSWLRNQQFLLPQEDWECNDVCKGEADLFLGSFWHCINQGITACYDHNRVKNVGTVQLFKIGLDDLRDFRFADAWFYSLRLNIRKTLSIVLPAFGWRRARLAEHLQAILVKQDWSQQPFHRHLIAWNDFKSAIMPAPPLGSVPAMVRATGK